MIIALYCIALTNSSQKYGGESIDEPESDKSNREVDNSSDEVKAEAKSIQFWHLGWEEGG